MMKFEKDLDLGKESRMGSSNTCCHSVQNVACTHLYNWHSSHFVWVWNLASYVTRTTQMEGLWEEGGEDNTWCGREVGIDACRRFCSALHVCYCSADIVSVIVARKIIHTWADWKVSRLIFLFRIRWLYKPYNFFFRSSGLHIEYIFYSVLERFKHMK